MTYLILCWWGNVIPVENTMKNLLVWYIRHEGRIWLPFYMVFLSMTGFYSSLMYCDIYTEPVQILTCVRSNFCSEIISIFHYKPNTCYTRRMPSPGMRRHVDLMNWIDVSEERIASIFRVEQSASEEPVWAGGCSCYTTSEAKNENIRIQYTLRIILSFKRNTEVWLQKYMPRTYGDHDLFIALTCISRTNTGFVF
jgi:hypothetical protein